MDLKLEKELWKEGKRFVVGLDESGRGPLAGPVTACALTIEEVESVPKELRAVNDSKSLSPSKRERLYDALDEHPLVEWEVSWVTSSVIDRINILEATKLAMKRAVGRLSERLGEEPGILLIDGRVEVRNKTSQIFIDKGDRKVFSCAAASIMAKVFRDRTMRRYHGEFPEYEFEKHKGYATRLHRKLLRENGPSRIHRRSFNPVKRLDF